MRDGSTSLPASVEAVISTRKECHMMSRMYNTFVTGCHKSHILSILLILTISGPLEFCANGLIHYLPENGPVRFVIDKGTKKPVKCPKEDKNHAKETVSKAT